MKKFLMLVLALFVMINNAYALGSWPIDVYKVNCLSQTKEFSVEVVRAIWKNSKERKKMSLMRQVTMC